MALLHKASGSRNRDLFAMVREIADGVEQTGEETIESHPAVQAVVCVLVQRLVAA